MWALLSKGGWIQYRLKLKLQIRKSKNKSTLKIVRILFSMCGAAALALLSRPVCKDNSLLVAGFSSIINRILIATFYNALRNLLTAN